MLHAEPALLVVAPPALQPDHLAVRVVLLVHEHPRNTAGAAVQVLITAPTSRVHAPVVQLQVHVSGRVSEVPAGPHAPALRELR